jgi:hypothetical protein
MHTSRRTRPSLACFNVVLATWDPADAVVLHSARTADETTVAFHQVRQRLIQDLVGGELLVVHHDGETRTLLREPLDTGVSLLIPVRQRRARVGTVPAPAREEHRNR